MEEFKMQNILTANKNTNSVFKSQYLEKIKNQLDEADIKEMFEKYYENGIPAEASSKFARGCFGFDSDFDSKSCKGLGVWGYSQISNSNSSVNEQVNLFEKSFLKTATEDIKRRKENIQRRINEGNDENDVATEQQKLDAVIFFLVTFYSPVLRALYAEKENMRTDLYSMHLDVIGSCIELIDNPYVQAQCLNLIGAESSILLLKKGFMELGINLKEGVIKTFSQGEVVNKFFEENQEYADTFGKLRDAINEDRYKKTCEQAKIICEIEGFGILKIIFARLYDNKNVGYTPFFKNTAKCFALTALSTALEFLSYNTDAALELFIAEPSSLLSGLVSYSSAVISAIIAAFVVYSIWQSIKLIINVKQCNRRAREKSISEDDIAKGKEIIKIATELQPCFRNVYENIVNPKQKQNLDDNEIRDEEDKKIFELKKKVGELEDELENAKKTSAEKISNLEHSVSKLENKLNQIFGISKFNRSNSLNTPKPSIKVSLLPA